MDRAWELFWKLDHRDKMIHGASPAEWVENKEYWVKTWLEYKNKIPRIMRPFMLLNGFSYYMEYCARLVTESDETLRMPLLPEGHNSVLYKGNTTSEQKE